MALINHAKGEINAKLVYVGPASAGKATNLNHIYGKLKESFRGSFKSMNLQNDRMLFFDFLPSGQGNVNGYSVRFHVYTITGEVTHPSSWKMVLKGADGLVFVADSGPDRMAANMESLKGVKAAIASYGKAVSDIPCVIQCNKRDVTPALDLEVLGRALNPGNCPQVPAVAGRGEGVLDSLFTLVKMVLKNLRAAGLDLQGEPEQLQRTAEPAAPARPGTLPVAETPHGAGPGVSAGVPEPLMAAPSEQLLPAVEEELLVEIVGGAELAEKGRVRLPLSIRYGGKEKRMTLDISLTAVPD
ncbi:MAG TPA: ADP-ribosylation factor-like protein [Geobacteraceae bacterium]